MKSYDLNLLTALDALLSTNSVTEAARRMHLSTPAMSHTLARIREMVGDPLLVRAGRKLVPTPRALELREPVSQLLAQASTLFAQDAGDVASIRRSFVVRAPDGVSVVFGAPLSLALQELMPAASIRFVSDGDTDIGALREGRIDLDIGSFRNADPEIRIAPLAEQKLVGAVRSGHPMLKGKLTAKRFAAERHVAVAPRRGETSLVDDALTQAGLERFIALTVHSSHGALVVAARSQLVACVPGAMARGVQAFCDIEIFELPLALPNLPMLMAWHPRYDADPAHAALRDCVTRIMNKRNWKGPPRDGIDFSPVPRRERRGSTGKR